MEKQNLLWRKHKKQQNDGHPWFQQFAAFFQQFPKFNNLLPFPQFCAISLYDFGAFSHMHVGVVTFSTTIIFIFWFSCFPAYLVLLPALFCRLFRILPHNDPKVMGITDTKATQSQGHTGGLSHRSSGRRRWHRHARDVSA